MANERRRRFLAYFKTKYKGSRADLIRDSGLTKGRIAQLFDEKQPFGEHAARNLARALQLPEDFFEKDETPAAELSREAMEMAVSFDRLSETDRERLRLLIQVVRGEISPGKPPVIDKSRPEEGLIGGLRGLDELVPSVNIRKKKGKP